MRNEYRHETLQQQLKVNSTGTHLQESILTAPQHTGRSRDIIVARDRFVVGFNPVLLRHFVPLFKNNGIAFRSDEMASLSLPECSRDDPAPLHVRDPLFYQAYRLVLAAEREAPPLLRRPKKNLRSAEGGLGSTS